jgi:hypothetical protein
MLHFYLGLLMPLAEAKSSITKPYMYGWGPSVNTMLYPFQYPYVFPQGKNQADPPSDQLNEMRQDLGFGPKFIMYMNRRFRLSAYPYLHVGANESGYRSAGLSLEGDVSALVDNNIIAFYGVGGGSNIFAFDQGNDGRISGQQLYAKGQIGGIYFDKFKAYELALYLQFGFTGVEQFEYDGSTYENSLGEGDQLTTSLYTPTVGIQATYYVGDFRKMIPKKGKGKGSKKKKKK